MFARHPQLSEVHDSDSCCHWIVAVIVCTVCSPDFFLLHTSDETRSEGRRDKRHRLNNCSTTYVIQIGSVVVRKYHALALWPCYGPLVLPQFFQVLGRKRPGSFVHVVHMGS